jgi:hypothetical protein
MLAACVPDEQKGGGACRALAEVPYPKEACSEFVLETVIPSLRANPEDFSMPDVLAARLAAWLKAGRSI